MNTKTDIQTHWFPDHEASIEHTPRATFIDWRKKGTSMYAMNIILSGRNVFISGDVGEAVFTFSTPVTIEELGSMNLDYLVGKLTAFSNSTYIFDSEKAKKEYEDFLDDNPLIGRYNDHMEIHSQMKEIIDQSTSRDEFVARVHSLYYDTSLDSDDIDLFMLFGQKIHNRLAGYQVAFEMIKEQMVAAA